MSFFDFFESRKGHRGFRNVLFVDSISDIPHDTKENIYIVRDGGYEKWVAFMCPNRCGTRIEVNLMRSRYPRWKLKLKNGKVTLYPSVIATECGAHFWLDKNRVIWSFED